MPRTRLACFEKRLHAPPCQLRGLALDDVLDLVVRATADRHDDPGGGPGRPSDVITHCCEVSCWVLPWESVRAAIVVKPGRRWSG